MVEFAATAWPCSSSPGCGPRWSDSTPSTSTTASPQGIRPRRPAIYCALGLLLAAHFKALPLRVAIWTVAISIPIIVAFSRMYRGEHHPIDVIAGAMMGSGAMLVALFAVRTARAVAELRAEKKSAEVVLA